jgi:hypothetical protein
MVIEQLLKLTSTWNALALTAFASSLAAILWLLVQARMPNLEIPHACPGESPQMHVLQTSSLHSLLLS